MVPKTQPGDQNAILVYITHILQLKHPNPCVKRGAKTFQLITVCSAKQDCFSLLGYSSLGYFAKKSEDLTTLHQINDGIYER
jgi:hypothetical protein